MGSREQRRIQTPVYIAADNPGKNVFNTLNTRQLPNQVMIPYNIRDIHVIFWSVNVSFGFCFSLIFILCLTLFRLIVVIYN